jgi:16S rRNA (cytosine1402-N4)-methyltransferase
MYLCTEDTISHQSVLLNEVLHYMAPKAGEVIVDGTFGAGGYSDALLAAAPCRIYAIDRDPDVLPFAERLAEKYGAGRFTLLQGAFGDMEHLLAEHGITQVDGIVLDLGVSSMQLDTAGRGFSFMADAPLDMRMSKEGRDASLFINEATEEEIADTLFLYGGERKSRRIARKIVEERQKEPITRTGRLASIIRSGVGHHNEKIDAATRSFQAIRIWVNDELGELERVLAAAEKLLAPGGRLVVISFHSLEDTIIKHFLEEKSGKREAVSRHVPVYTEHQPAILFRYLDKHAVKPTEEEIKRNPRSRSAKLRAAIRTEERVT